MKVLKSEKKTVQSYRIIVKALHLWKHQLTWIDNRNYQQSHAKCFNDFSMFSVLECCGRNIDWIDIVRQILNFYLSLGWWHSYNAGSGSEPQLQVSHSITRAKDWYSTVDFVATPYVQ
jgi:hypothetical protein